MEQLRRLGFKVYVLDNLSDIDLLLREVSEGGLEGFGAPGERASGSFSAENGRQPRGKALQEKT
jgi:hypothetical protein